MIEKNINDKQVFLIKHVCEYIMSGVKDDETTFLLHNMYFREEALDKSQNTLRRLYYELKKIAEMYNGSSNI